MRETVFSARHAIAACLLASVGCGGGGAVVSLDAGPEPSLDLGTEAFAEAEVVILDPGPEPGLPELPVEHGPDDPGPPDVEVQTGDECKSGADCASGICVEDQSGRKVCALPCLDEPCPEGWSCKAVTNTGGDVTFVCMPLVVRLCWPCNRHEDCRPPDVATKDLCVDHGGEKGHFCGQDCSQDGQCPEGFACESVKAEEGVEYWQCVPEDAECECSEESVVLGRWTTCTRSNEHGECEGVRTCKVEGLTPCDAPEPAVEACGGGDEDCDGEQDDEGAAGCTTWCKDADGDGYGADCRCLCAPSGEHKVATGGDCDDVSGAVHPGATEVCNGIDDDCADGTDEDFKTGDLYLGDDDCGACGVSCEGVVPNGASVCQDVGGVATCVFAGCDPGFEEVLPGVCGPAGEGLCRPCGDSLDCPAWLACVPLGGGKFCLRGCDGGCPPGYACGLAGGSEACLLATGGCAFEGKPCAADWECEDLDPCTAGVCAGGAACALAPIDCDDGNPCTADACGVDGCEHVAVEYSEPCYEGPEGTQDVPPCRAGLRTCSGQVLGPCEGQVLPGVEACDGKDNDCTGVPDEGCNVVGIDAHPAAGHVRDARGPVMSVGGGPGGLGGAGGVELYLGLFGRE